MALSRSLSLSSVLHIHQLQLVHFSNNISTTTTQNASPHTPAPLPYAYQHCTLCRPGSTIHCTWYTQALASVCLEFDIIIVFIGGLPHPPQPWNQQFTHQITPNNASITTQTVSSHFPTPLPLYYQHSTASRSWSTLLITSYTKALSPSLWVFTMFSSVEDCHTLPHPQTITTYMTSHLPMQMLLYRMHPHTP